MEVGARGSGREAHRGGGCAAVEHEHGRCAADVQRGADGQLVGACLQQGRPLQVHPAVNGGCPDLRGSEALRLLVRLAGQPLCAPRLYDPQPLRAARRAVRRRYVPRRQLRGLLRLQVLGGQAEDSDHGVGALLFRLRLHERHAETVGGARGRCGQYGRADDGRGLDRQRPAVLLRREPDAGPRPVGGFDGAAADAQPEQLHGAADFERELRAEPDDARRAHRHELPAPADAERFGTEIEQLHVARPVEQPEIRVARGA